MNRAGPPDAARWFAERYGREPEGVWFAPGRVNLMGGPDYTEVFVLPFALPIGVYAAASRRSDRQIALAQPDPIAGGDGRVTQDPAELLFHLLVVAVVSYRRPPCALLLSPSPASSSAGGPTPASRRSSAGSPSSCSSAMPCPGAAAASAS